MIKEIDLIYFNFLIPLKIESVNNFKVQGFIVQQNESRRWNIYKNESNCCERPNERPP
jgi:hypothetical protein